MEEDTIIQNLDEYKLLYNLCVKGKTKDLLALIKKFGYDSTFARKTFSVPQDRRLVPIATWGLPFLAACGKNNYPIVRLLLLIGADPDSRYGDYLTVRNKYHDSQLQELFDGGRCWWKVEYADAKKQELQNELECDIMKGEASEAIWLMKHGVRLASPSVLEDVDFGKLPRAFQEVVCRMGIPENCLQDFHSFLKKDCSGAEVVDILDTLLESKGDEGRDAAEKLLLSMDLLGEDILDELVNSSFPIPVNISMIQHFINAYDASEHKQFIEKIIAQLFMDLLYSCMEV